jgi:hypothetical protein
LSRGLLGVFDARALTPLVELGPHLWWLGLGLLLLDRALDVSLRRRSISLLARLPRSRNPGQHGGVNDDCRGLTGPLLCDRGERVVVEKEKEGESKNYSCIPALVPEGVWLHVNKHARSTRTCGSG